MLWFGFDHRSRITVYPCEDRPNPKDSDSAVGREREEQKERKVPNDQLSLLRLWDHRDDQTCSPSLPFDLAI